ncbi:MAG: hypothetical protein IRZ10_08580 [Thermoflavifilum sp.]|nr:hypothetical protein [Thermoflavifilum sp.]MCL6514467.1 hypothetical protein [Alicyclobacillus sp.]
MTRWMEIPWIIAMAGCTVWGTTAALQQLSNPDSTASRWLQPKLEAVWHTLQQAQQGTPTSSKGSGSPANVATSAAVSSSSAPGNAAAGTVSLSGMAAGWSSEDTAELQAVIADVDQHWTQSDWKQLALRFTEPPAQAAQDVPAFLQSHLTKDEWSWIREHIPDEAAWQSDLSLLHQAGWQWLTSLTPEQQAWLMDEVNRWLGTQPTSVAAAGSAEDTNSTAVQHGTAVP